MVGGSVVSPMCAGEMGRVPDEGRGGVEARVEPGSKDAVCADQEVCKMLG